MKRTEPTKSIVTAAIFIVLLAVCTVILPGCGGQEQSDPITLGTAEIVWTGYADQDETFLLEFNATMACIQNNGGNIIRPAGIYPFIEIVSDNFLCENVYASGCAVIDWGLIVLADDNKYFSFPHELIHWATGIGNEGHGTDLFNTCAQATIEVMGPQ